MEELHQGFWISLLMLLGGGGGQDADASATGVGATAPYSLYAIESGDTYELTYAIEEAYAAAGVSLNDTLTWQFQPYDGLVNWYNEHTQVINLSEFPQDAEIAAYWDTWSAALTGGAWDWHAFFADADEARDLARFNQFVLAAHEYGHALTYRYDPDHVARDGGEVNCRELPADRLAAGLLEELAAAEPRLALWRLRYGALLAAINAAIDPAIRVTLTDYPSLAADCHIIHVEQPDETSMAPYASAYFARWQVLLDTDLPPLADLYETYLYAPWRAALPPSAPLAGPVSSPDWIDDTLSGTFERDGVNGWHLAAFGPDGALYALDYLVDADKTGAGLELAFGRAGGKHKTVIDTDRLAVDLDDPAFFDINAFLPLGPDRFVLASADLFGAAGSVVVIVAERTPGGWVHRLTQPLPGIANPDTRLRLAADGTIRLDLYQFGTGETADHWQSYPFDPETLETGPPETLSDTRYTWYNDLPDGRHLLLDPDRPMVLFAEGDDIVRIAGNGLQGYKDESDPLAAEFAQPLAATLHDSAIRILDVDPFTDSYIIRQVPIRQ